MKDRGTIYDTSIGNLADGLEKLLSATGRADSVRYDNMDDEDVSLNGIYQGTIYLLRISKEGHEFKVYVSDHMLRDRSFASNILYVSEIYLDMLRKWKEGTQYGKTQALRQ